MTSKKKFLLSVIVPVYFEEGNIDPLLDRLIPAIQEYTYEIIFVNDGSKDKTIAEIKKHTKDNKDIKLISFTRNFSHQTALTAGYEYAKGDVVVTIDADLQDPPELIPEMVIKWQNGSNVVYAKRTTRNESFFKTATADFFYWLINILSHTKIPKNVGDYRLVDRKVVTILNNMPEKSRFLRGMVSWGGFEADYVTFERNEREVGETHYPFKKMLTFALDGIISFSTKPLKIATYFGFAAGSLGFLGILYAFYRRLFLSPEYWVEGWTATFVGIMFFGGIQLITIGIIGEYIARIYTQVQNRPDYLVDETVNI